MVAVLRKSRLFAKISICLFVSVLFLVGVSSLPAYAAGQPQLIVENDDVRLELKITNAPAAENGVWAKGEKIKYDLVLENKTGRFKSFQPVASNLEGQWQKCKWSKNVGQGVTKTDCKNILEHTVTDADVANGSFQPYIAYDGYPQENMGGVAEAAAQIGTAPDPGEGTDPEKAVTITAPVTVTDDDYEITIKVANTPSDGAWNLNDEVEFNIEVTNKSGAVRAFELVSTNLTEALRCKWVGIPDGETKTCAASNGKKTTHTINSQDVAAGVFAPWAVYTIHESNNYASDIYDVVAVGDPKTSDASYSVSITNPKSQGQKWIVGETVQYSLSMANNSGIDRSFKLVSSNAENTSTCMWNNLQNGVTKTCDVANHRITKADAERGYFTPYFTWKMYSSTGYPENSGSNVELPVLVGPKVLVAEPVIDTPSIVLHQDSVKDSYQAGDKLKFVVTALNPNDADVALQPTGLKLIRTGAEQQEVVIDSASYQRECAITVAAKQNATCSFEYELTKDDVLYGYVTLAAALRANIEGGEPQSFTMQAYGVPVPAAGYPKASGFKQADADPLKPNDYVRKWNSDAMMYLSKGTGEYNIRIPAIAVAANGDLLASYDLRPKGNGDGGGDSPNPNWIVQRRSTDNGQTWGPLTVIAMGKSGDGKYGYSDPSYVVDHITGKIFNFHVYSQNQGFGGGQYTKKDGTIDEQHPNTMNLGLAVSDDNGYSWSRRVVTAQVLSDKVPGIRSCFATSGAGTQKMQQPYKGRLLQQVGCRSDNGSIVAFTMYSDDHGETWKSGEPTSNTMTDGTSSNFDENKVVELSDGTLLLNSRVNSGAASGYRIVGISKDGGQSWQDLHADKNLKDATNNAQVIRAFPNAEPGTLRSKVLLFSNTPNGSGNRASGYFWISYDDGKNWKQAKKIRTAGTGYTTMAVQSDGTIGLLLEPDGSGWSNVAYMNVSLAWIDPDLESELKAKAGVAKTGTDYDQLEAISLGELFDHNDPILKDTVVVEGLPNGLAYDAQQQAIVGTPKVRISEETSYSVTIKLSEEDDGTGRARSAQATFTLTLQPAANLPKLVDSKVTSNTEKINVEVTDPVSCTQKPYFTIYETEGVHYYLRNADGSLAADALTVGNHEYPYGQTVMIVAQSVDEDQYELQGQTEWQFTAPTFESLNCGSQEPVLDPGVEDKLAESGSSIAALLVAQLALVGAGIVALAIRRRSRA